MSDVLTKTNLDNLVVFNPGDKVKIIDTLCGLANGKDAKGYLFGVSVVDNNGEPVLLNTRSAQRQAESIMESINQLGKMVFPEYLPTMSLVEKDGVAIILCECYPGDNFPYIYPENLESQNFIEGTNDLVAFAIKEQVVESKPIPTHIQSFELDLDDEEDEEPIIEEAPKVVPEKVVEEKKEKPVVSESKPVIKEIIKKNEEPEETRVIHFTSKMNKEYIYQKDFVGTIFQQLQAFNTHLVNNYIESKLYPDAEQQEYNYNPDTIMMMCKEAYKVAYENLDITLTKEDFRIAFDCDDNLEFNDLDWDVDFSDRTEFVLPINQGYIHRPQDNVVGNNRRSNAEIRSLVLEVLTEPMSTNELAKKMGYKGISKTLSQIVKELVNEEKIEYMNPDNPRSSNQKLRRKF